MKRHVPEQGDDEHVWEALVEPSGESRLSFFAEGHNEHEVGDEREEEVKLVDESGKPPSLGAV